MDAWENGERVAATWPEFDHVEPELRRAADGVLDIMRRGMVFVCESGHRDAALPRAAALACLLGLYANQSEAAKRLNLSVSTVCRALGDLEAELFTQRGPPLVETNENHESGS